MIKKGLLLLLLLSPFLLADSNRTIPLDKLFQVELPLKNKLYKVWLALDPKQKEEGLSHLSLDEVSSKEGMLFIYPYEEKLAFWMKDTFFDLDIAYIKSDGTVVDMFTMEKMSRKASTSSQKVRYVLELHAGEFEKIGLRLGEKILFSKQIKELAL
jgi:hypothetical protein